MVRRSTRRAVKEKKVIVESDEEDVIDHEEQEEASIGVSDTKRKRTSTLKRNTGTKAKRSSSKGRTEEDESEPNEGNEEAIEEKDGEREKEEDEIMDSEEKEQDQHSEEEDESKRYELLRKKIKFKNEEYLKKIKKKRSKWKILKHLINLEKFEEYPVSVPTYVNIEVPPSLYPPKRYCDVTGLEGKYQDPTTKLRYNSVHIYKHIIEPSLHNNQQRVEDYLEFRKSNVKI